MTKMDILIVEDESAVAGAISRALKSSYNVTTAGTVKEALSFIEQQKCDLVLLDVILPDMSGYWLCQRIKSDLFLRHIPVIFLTGLDGQESIVNGLKMGADDYIEKPFSVQELLARTEAAIRRSESTLEANPLSRLPGNGFIEREILRRLDDRQIFSLLYIDLNHFKAYNDHYGFHRGDQVIRTTAHLLADFVEGGARRLGHVGGDDFILLVGDEDVHALCQTILLRFDAVVPTFYDEKDRQAGHVRTRDRQGQWQTYPLLSMAIGVVTNKIRPISTLGEVSAIGAEVKACAKRLGGSAYFVDRRRDPYLSFGKEEEFHHGKQNS